MQCEDSGLELCADGVGKYSIMGSLGIGASDHEEIKRMDYDNLTHSGDESPSGISINNISSNLPILKDKISVFLSELLSVIVCN